MQNILPDYQAQGTAINKSGNILDHDDIHVNDEKDEHSECSKEG